MEIDDELLRMITLGMHRAEEEISRLKGELMAVKIVTPFLLHAASEETRTEVVVGLRLARERLPEANPTFAEGFAEAQHLFRA